MIENKKVTLFRNEKGMVEYNLVGFDTVDDFNLIKESLEKEGASQIDLLDGIYSRIGKFKSGAIEFRLIFHEDVGNYLTGEKKDKKTDEFLLQLAEKVMYSLVN